MPDFLLPDLGEGLEEAEIVAWRVNVGDTVHVDQIVVEVETAKAAVEVPVPFAGTVTALHAEPGSPIPVGAPLLSVSETAAGFAEPGVTTPDPAPAAGSGNVLIGYGTSEPTRRARRPRRQAPVRHATPVAASPATPKVAVAVISPLVRKVARDAGLDLTRLTPSQPNGVLRRADIDRALQHVVAPIEASSEERRIPIRGLRKTTADKLARSRREIPEATVWVDVDATALSAARTEINARSPQHPIGLLALLARFTTLALRRYPELNATIDGDEIVIPDYVHLGFAAQTVRGLVVPVIRDAHKLSTRELAAAISDRTIAARTGSLAPADLTGSTITINNYGVFGVDGSAAIINHPEVAILGMGRIIDRPWVVDGELAVRKITQLTLAFDHRVCDGGTAGGFLRLLADYVESPVAAMAEL